MSARKKQASDADVAVLEPPATRSGGRRWLPALLIGLILVGIACYLVWHQVRDHVLAAGQYQLDASCISITPLPPWIHSDIKAEVVRDASFGGPLSLLDGQLTVRMATAFTAHPWVAHVERVSKHFPARLDVVLLYRKPVAMVEVEDGTGALPVDEKGIVLPTGDFTADDAERYPRIGEIHTTPAGPVGAAWGDANVSGAAQIAAALAADWRTLKLFRIVPAGQRPGRSGAEPIFNLITHSGGQVCWGRAPSTSLPNEVSATEKIAQLKRFAAENNGSLDLPDGAYLEIHDDGALHARPRPDVRPLPKQGD